MDRKKRYMTITLSTFFMFLMLFQKQVRQDSLILAASIPNIRILLGWWLVKNFKLEWIIVMEKKVIFSSEG